LQSSFVVGPGDYYIRMMINGGVSTPDSLATGGGTVAVSVVPVPAAVWLFGSALAAFGWLRKK